MKLMVASVTISKGDAAVALPGSGLQEAELNFSTASIYASATVKVNILADVKIVSGCCRIYKRLIGGPLEFIRRYR